MRKYLNAMGKVSMLLVFLVMVVGCAAKHKTSRYKAMPCPCEQRR